MGHVILLLIPDNIILADATPPSTISPIGIVVYLRRARRGLVVEI